MKINYLCIKNFKSIRELIIEEVDQALILVGKNNTGKTVIIDAIRAISGEYIVKNDDYLEPEKSIVIEMKVEISEEDMLYFHSNRIISKYKRYDLWTKEFNSRLQSLENGIITFQCIIKNGRIKYDDGFKRNNLYIKEIFPKIYHIDHRRNLNEIQNDVIRFYDKQSITEFRDNQCIFDKAKPCNRCFQCIGVINKKKPDELTAYETGRLLEYKLYNMNLSEFSDKVNNHFRANGGTSREIKYDVDFNVEDMFKIETQVYNKERDTYGSLHTLSEGLRSIYALSLLETYIEEENTIPCIIMIEDPEMYLHPQLQKVASEILYRLSKKNQVIFSTHSPNMIFNFSTKQIKQVMLDEEYFTIVNKNTDIDEILDDLGYTANDLMNVSFVFIVEGKQDSNRLPLLLEKYYKEIYDESGKLQRITIIPTNSCTNIKTYANLKYINKLYLKDQFLMIRDSDGKNPKYLIKQLCNYYSERAKEDIEGLPNVTPKNVLILNYYSFENYFLDPVVMEKIGVIKNQEDFYNVLYTKYKDYLYKLPSFKRMIKQSGVRINSKNDIKENIELIKKYVRGHNLFDIFYGKYHGSSEEEILKKYIEVAPREDFKDILDSIDSFIYFENRKKMK
ncbi:ATP-dependent nuclease [Anaeromicropila herbilytica]|uniref:ATP-dependent endonuclease n=1 Tax=Anaeromicropila herbilytica TaxID=2785025 RepID=A0A7R7EHC4_9FIRM|nr:AAA family ATPase [Anaeromicropila herbilytica]BCN28755.1 ATP-dependent endonuclease [Anaeromicropila herbilytica]